MQGGSPCLWYLESTIIDPLLFKSNVFIEPEKQIYSCDETVQLSGRIVLPPIKGRCSPSSMVKNGFNEHLPANPKTNELFSQVSEAVADRLRWPAASSQKVPQKIFVKTSLPLETKHMTSSALTLLDLYCSMPSGWDGGLCCGSRSPCPSTWFTCFTLTASREQVRICFALPVGCASGWRKRQRRRRAESESFWLHCVIIS